MGKLIKTVLLVIASLFVVSMLISLGGFMAKFDTPEANVKKNSILVLDLEGVIVDGKKFLADLKKYSAEDQIKGVLVRINSPGGVVGPSQEIYAELNRVREELKKPVVVACNAMAASGAYYAAVAADQIVANPGTLMGSIGVIMEFANLENLYRWAKIKRYSLKTGKFKDSGTDTRGMSSAERNLFQNLIDEVQLQFKQAVATRRKLSAEVVDKYADGRIFTGATAVKLGFADQVGTYSDAIKIIGELAGIGTDPEIFKPKEPRAAFFEMLLDSKGSAKPLFSNLEELATEILKLKTSGAPLMVYPGALGL